MFTATVYKNNMMKEFSLTSLLSERITLTSFNS